MQEVLLKFRYRKRAPLTLEGQEISSPGRDLDEINAVLARYESLKLRFSFERSVEFLRNAYEAAGQSNQGRPFELDLYVRALVKEKGQSLADELRGISRGRDSELEGVFYPMLVGPPPQEDRESDQAYCEAGIDLCGEVLAGVDAFYSWSLPDNAGTGAGVQIFLIDEQYRDRKLDEGTEPMHPDVDPVILRSADDDTISSSHALHALGVMAAKRDEQYVSGIAHGVDTCFTWSYAAGPWPEEGSGGEATGEEGSDDDVKRGGVLAGLEATVVGVDSMTVPLLAEGDVVLVEAQAQAEENGDSLPVDWWPDVAEYIRTLCLPVAEGGRGYVVVLPAGNSNVSLTEFTHDGRAPWTAIDPPDDPDHVLVGAGIYGGFDESGGPSRARRSASNHGVRVDCQGWGDSVLTLDRDGAQLIFEPDFDGTSSAAAIVAGVVACLQGFAKVKLSSPLSSAEVRTKLRQDENGSPQCFVAGLTAAEEAKERVGPLPDLGRLYGSLGWSPDAYVRDSLLDDGSEPSAGKAFWSPDIITRAFEVANPDEEFGASTLQSEYQGHDVVSGQDNFVYLRVGNRGRLPDTLEATVYWSEVSTFTHPAYWTLIGSTELEDLPVGAWRVSPVIRWKSNQLPDPGSYCLIAALDSRRDGLTIPESFPSLPSYAQWLLDHNNVAHRNVKVVDAPLARSFSMVRFRLRGLPVRRFPFRIVFSFRLPEDATVEISIDRPLWHLRDGRERELDELSPRGPLVFRGGPRFELYDVMLGGDSYTDVTVKVHGDGAFESLRGDAWIRVDQYFERLHVGRVTLEMRRHVASA